VRTLIHLLILALALTASTSTTARTLDAKPHQAAASAAQKLASGPSRSAALADTWRGGSQLPDLHQETGWSGSATASGFVVWVHNSNGCGPSLLSHADGSWTVTTAAGKRFRGTDPLVPDAILAIERAMPGEVVAVGVKIRRVPFTRPGQAGYIGDFTDIDIVTRQALIQVKGTGTGGLETQLFQQSLLAGGMQNLGLAPGATTHTIGRMYRGGAFVVRSIDDLIPLLRR
jgi:hypothetical protein